MFVFCLNECKHQLQSIISGISNHSAEDIIKAADYYIRESQKTIRNTEKSEFSKKQEATQLIEHSFYKFLQLNY